MAMTIESIRKVQDINTPLLLEEPRFDVTGKTYELLTERELEHVHISNTAGVERNDFIEEIITYPRNIIKMADILDRGYTFGLERPEDARLIYTCIDTFIMAQARILPQTLGGVSGEHLDDFRSLTNLANYILKWVDLADRIDLTNAPQKENEEYTIFDFLGVNYADNGISSTVIENGKLFDTKDDGYKSPFSNLLRSQRAAEKASGINRIKRFME